MPEIPEIASRAKEIKQYLTGKSIVNVEILQPKCLNISPEAFQSGLIGATILDSSHRGKWIQVKLTSGWLLLNLGMGGDLLLTDRDHLPDKYVMVIDFNDATCLTIRFWWFGYIHFALPEELAMHTMTAKLGPDILDLSELEFTNLVKSQKGKVKAILLDQTKMAGIGNAYVHDILFLAKLHPNRLVKKMSEEEITRLYQACRDGLVPSLQKGGAFYEKDLHGNKGGFTMDEIIIGYREGSPCPNCQTPIIKIKTGGTSSFICPHCQPEE
jgi:formamidopyrimidine-DNA glycosylase